MGNRFIFPVPKQNYTQDTDPETLIYIPSQIQDSAGCFSGTKTVPNQIPARYYKTISGAKTQYALIVFHGNSEQLGKLTNKYLQRMSYRLLVNIICQEYPKYGIYKKKDKSQDMPNAILNDARAVIKYVNEELKYPMDRIILFGRSIGSGIAVQMAGEFNIRGLVLISAYTSIRDVIKHKATCLLTCCVSNMLRSKDKIDKVKCPVLLIHGKKDNLIPSRMSVELSEQIKGEKKVKIHPEMDHNKFVPETDIYQPMQAFFAKELNM